MHDVVIDIITHILSYTLTYNVEVDMAVSASDCAAKHRPGPVEAAGALCIAEKVFL